MQKYTALVKHAQPELPDGVHDIYIAGEADDVLAGASQALNAAKARIRELQTSLAEVRESFNAVCNRRDAMAARIAELEKALRKLIDACHEPDDDGDPECPVNEAKRALMGS